MSDWQDVQRLPILPKPLNNLSNLIFKMFTVSADSCAVQQRHQGERTYPLPSQPEPCRRYQPERGVIDVIETWLEVMGWLLIYKDRECLDRTGKDVQEKA